MGEGEVAAAEDQDGLAVLYSVFQGLGSGEGGCACALGEVVGLFEHLDDGAADVVLGDEDVVVEEVTDDGLGAVERDADGDALGEGGGWGVDEAAFFPGQVRGRERLRRIPR